MEGDFNTPSNHRDDCHPTCHAKGNEMLDIISAKRLSLINKDGQHTWRQAQCSSLLDLVFVTGEISEATTIHEGRFLEASNHRLLWWNIPKLQYVTYQVIIPDSLEEQTFIAFIQERWASISLLLVIEIPDAMQQASKQILTVWTALASTHTQSQKSKNWWNQELTNIRNNVLNSTRPHKELKTAIKCTRQEHFDQLIGKLADNK